MKNIVVALKSDIAKIIYVMVIIICCFLIPNMIGNCTANEPVLVDRYQQGVDSMKALYRIQDRLKLDSANKVSEKKIAILSKKIVDKDKTIEFLKTENESLTDRYENDPDLASCDSLVRNQKKIITEQSTLIKDLKEDVSVYSSLVSNLKQDIVYVEVDKSETIKELKVKEATIQDIYKQLTKNQKKYKFWKGVLQVVAVAEAIVIVVK